MTAARRRATRAPAQQALAAEVVHEERVTPQPPAATTAPAALDPRAPCPCRRIADKLYIVVAGCPRHDESKHPSHMQCCCGGERKWRCFVCDENEIRGPWSGE